MSGTADLVVAGGVQNMSMIPIAAAMIVADRFGFSDPFSGSKGWKARYGDQPISQFRSAEMIAEKWNLSRQDMEAFALESHRRAIAATDEGRFVREIVPLAGVTADEGPRRDTRPKSWPASRRWPKGGGSPRACPAKSRTARAPC